MFYAINFKKIFNLIFKLVLVLILFVSISYALKLYLPLNHVDVIYDKALKYNLKPELICAIIRTESRFREDVVSNKGATGLMQIMEPTALWAAKEIGISNFNFDQITDPKINIEIGCWYINKLSDQFNNLDVALAAYNAGSGNVSNWLNDERYSHDGKNLYYIPFKETREYIKKINNYQKFYKYILMLSGGKNEK